MIWLAHPREPSLEDPLAGAVFRATAKACSPHLQAAMAYQLGEGPDPAPHFGSRNTARRTLGNRDLTADRKCDRDSTATMSMFTPLSIARLLSDHSSAQCGDHSKYLTHRASWPIWKYFSYHAEVCVGGGSQPGLALSRREGSTLRASARKLLKELGKNGIGTCQRVEPPAKMRVWHPVCINGG